MQGEIMAAWKGHKGNRAAGVADRTKEIHRPGSSVPELSNPVKAAPELSSSQHLSTSLQRLYRYFATVVRYFATSR